MAQPYLSIIIPAYNEAERIPQTLVDIDRRLQAAEYSYEILVVNDGSTDATALIVTSMIPMIRNLKLLNVKVNGGKGGTVKAGMLEASGKIRLFTDADNSTSIDHFENMMPYFKEGYDVVIGSRAARGAKLDPPEGMLRRILGKIGNLTFQLTLGLWGIWDTQCGFKAFTEEAAQRIFPLSRVAGWGFDAEVLTLAKRLGFTIKEIPVHWVNDTRSHVGMGTYAKVLGENFTIRVNLWRNAYGLRGSPVSLDKPSQEEYNDSH